MPGVPPLSPTPGQQADRHAMQAMNLAAAGRPRQASWEADHAYRNLAMQRSLGQPLSNMAMSVAGRGFQRRPIPGCTAYSCPWSPDQPGSGIRGKPGGMPYGSPAAGGGGGMSMSAIEDAVLQDLFG